MGQKNRPKVAKITKLAKSDQNGKKTAISPRSHTGKPGEAVRSIVTTGWDIKNGHPNTKVNFSCNKRLNLTTKFSVLGFLGIVDLQKKFGDSILKIVDFFIMSNFC